jgi:hypothetical protein
MSIATAAIVEPYGLPPPPLCLFWTLESVLREELLSSQARSGLVLGLDGCAVYDELIAVWSGTCLDRCRCENRTVRRRTRPPCPCDPHFCFYFLFISILCLGLFYSFLIFNTFVMVNSNSPPNIHHRFLLMFFHITLSVRLFVSQFFSVFKAIILCGLCE